MAHYVSKERFEELVEQALKDIPPQFAHYLEEISIEIRERPSPSDRKRMKLGPHDLLLGLYTGRPRTQRSVLDGPAMPDVIKIFRECIELASRSERELVQQVRKTVLHEIGHHFGMSEDDLDMLGYG